MSGRNTLPASDWRRVAKGRAGREGLGQSGASFRLRHGIQPVSCGLFLLTTTGLDGSLQVAGICIE